MIPILFYQFFHTLKKVCSICRRDEHDLSATLWDTQDEDQQVQWYSQRSKVQLSTKKVQLFACATAHKGKIGRSNAVKKGAAREARRAFFEHVGPSNFAFVCRGTGEKVRLFGRKSDL